MFHAKPALLDALMSVAVKIVISVTLLIPVKRCLLHFLDAGSQFFLLIDHVGNDSHAGVTPYGSRCCGPPAVAAVRGAGRGSNDTFCYRDGRFSHTTPPMTAYLWTKTAHLVFVIAWMASVFYLPRILVNIAEVGDVPAVRERLVLMGRRLYRFGHIMFGIALLFGLALWLHFGIGGGWMHAKLTLVLLMLVYFTVCGRWLKGVDKGRALPSAKAMRWINELPLFALIAVVYLVLAKPF